MLKATRESLQNDLGDFRRKATEPTKKPLPLIVPKQRSAPAASRKPAPHGRESNYSCHKARSPLLPLALLPWSLYLALPFNVSPLLVLLPCAALLALSVNLTTASFKRHL